MIEISKPLAWVLGIFAASGLLADIALIIILQIVRTGGEVYISYNNKKDGSEDRRQDSHN